MQIANRVNDFNSFAQLIRRANDSPFADAATSQHQSLHLRCVSAANISIKRQLLSGCVQIARPDNQRLVEHALLF